MDQRDKIWRCSAVTRSLESRAAAGMARLKLDAADFASQRNGDWRVTVVVRQRYDFTTSPRCFNALHRESGLLPRVWRMPVLPAKVLSGLLHCGLARTEQAPASSCFRPTCRRRVRSGFTYRRSRARSRRCRGWGGATASSSAARGCSRESLHVNFDAHPGMDAALEQMLSLRQASDIEMAALKNSGLGHRDGGKAAGALRNNARRATRVERR